jgi:hypothetical protein
LSVPWNIADKEAGNFSIYVENLFKTLESLRRAAIKQLAIRNERKEDRAHLSEAMEKGTGALIANWCGPLPLPARKR